jgi:2-polyprenyl-3-methyl-5-hydroxy-6-metoxy-1,4-benzoquinol methylase
MKLLQQLNNIDLYLLDQVQKGRITQDSKILDAGCGVGRNSKFFIEHGFSIKGFDPMAERIEEFLEVYPKCSEDYTVSTIEAYPRDLKFDFIICNAVLHFAASHEHFQLMMSSMKELLAENGILFIRMTSDFARESSYWPNADGRVDLPDGTNRYLLNKEQLKKALLSNKLKYIEPLKTVNVNNERCMSTLVLTNSKNVVLDLGWLNESENPMME